MSVVGRAMALPLWPPHSRTQIGMGRSRLSPGLAGTLLWHKAGAERSLLDSNGPSRERKCQKGQCIKRFIIMHMAQNSPGETPLGKQYEQWRSRKKRGDNSVNEGEK